MRSVSLESLAPEVQAKARKILASTGVMPGAASALLTTKPPRVFRRLEHQEQVRLIEWSRGAATLLEFPELALLYAIPNQVGFASKKERGSRRSQLRALDMLAEGLQPSFPDLCLPVPILRGPDHRYFGLYVELKRPDGGRLSPKQRWWLQELRGQGYATAVWCGCEEAKAGLISYLCGEWVNPALPGEDAC